MSDSAADQLAYTREHYTKYEYKIAMRDGVKLFTAVYLPKDVSQPYPIMMKRTPYSISPYGADNYKNSLGPTDLFTKEGFIFVYQDVRGRYMSEGVFEDIPPQDRAIDSVDTYDTIEWLLKNVPNHNGKVGFCGISYPGFFAGCSLLGSHPALKAVSPQAASADQGNGDDAYHHGCLHLAQEFGFYATFQPRVGDQETAGLPDFDYGTSDMYDFFLRLGPLSNVRKQYFQNPYWEDVIRNTNYYEPWWQVRRLANYIGKVTPAVMFVGGWFDESDLAGPLGLYQAVQANDASAESTLVMGPWRHSGWFSDDGDTLGNLNFAAKTGVYYRGQLELPFFVYHLKGKGSGLKPGPDSELPKAIVFETGRNQWRRFASWPPADTVDRRLYLDCAGKLDFAPAVQQGWTEYVSDPAKPVPLTAEVSGDLPVPSDYMTYDQRFASRRTDVLTYVTAPLTGDVTIAGPITVSLYVSTTGTDSDFVVKLIDVYPNDYPNPDPNPGDAQMGGYQQLVRGQPFRGKFRDSSVEKPAPAPFVPCEPARIRFELLDAFHTFRPGHGIMVQIQSSWFPLVDRNPQQFLDIPEATAEQFQTATQRVYHGHDEGSWIGLRVLEA